MTLAAVGDSIANYEYDHAGLRTAKTVDGKRTELINNGTSVVAELTEGEVTNYYRGLSLIGYNDGCDYYYYKLNAHGDTIGILNAFGEQVKEYSYDAYGNQEYADIFDTNPFRYCGEYYDNETGLIYLRARYYDSSIQRFITEDPARDWLNWYAYCGNNPVLYHDPSGEWIETALDVLSLGLSIADVISNPTDVWAWLGLGGDVLDVVLPFFGGLGEVIKASNGASKLVVATNKTDDIVDLYKGMKAADRAKTIGDGAVVMSYKNLKKISKGTGLEAHHLIEKRFADALGINGNDILSIAIDKDTHEKITKAFRNKIGYACDITKPMRTNTVNSQEVWKATVEVYTELGMEEYLPELKKQILDKAKNVKDITDWMGY